MVSFVSLQRALLSKYRLRWSGDWPTGGNSVSQPFSWAHPPWACSVLGDDQSFHLLTVTSFS